VVEGGITVVYDGVAGPWAVPAFLDGTALDRLHYAVASGHISMLAARRPTIDAADTRTGDRASRTSGSGGRTVDLLLARGEH
jgi:hypothetical protein